VVTFRFNLCRLKDHWHWQSGEIILIYACAATNRTFAQRRLRLIGDGPEASRADQHAGIVRQVSFLPLALLKLTLEKAGIPAQAFRFSCIFGTHVG